jgi:hypothetical protein
MGQRQFSQSAITGVAADTELRNEIEEQAMEEPTKSMKHPSTREMRFLEEIMSEDVHKARSMGVSVALGAAMGAAVGAATGHMGVWVAAGIAAYIAITFATGAWKANRE